MLVMMLLMMIVEVSLVMLEKTMKMLVILM